MSPTEHGRSASGSQSVPAIPLTDAKRGPGGSEPSVGQLVKDAASSMSTLFRSEVALAKSEMVDEAKKAGAGTALLAVAGVMALYASFFFFFFLAELLDEWLPRWLSFLIVFLILVLITVVAALVGYIIFKRVRGPKKTIESVKEIEKVLPGQHPPAAAAGAAGTSLPPGSEHPRIPAAREG